MGTSTQKIYTVLLYGETGVGKSTFINACHNYIKFPSLEEALGSSDICCRIPIKFSWQNDDYEDVIVEYGSDKNENLSELGVSATQSFNLHYYKFHDKLYRFADTPGFNDTRGYEIELENVKKMMNSLKNHFSDLSALCILLKPDENRETLRFRYGIMQFLSLFHRNMCGNIVFLYTHSKGTDYRHNTTGTMVRNIIDEIENNFEDISIPYGPNNVFMLDNDGFRYLLAVKLEQDSTDSKDNYREDWSKSANACYQLLEYIQTLDCRSIHDTLQLHISRLKLEDLLNNERLRLEEKENQLQMEISEYDLDIMRSNEYNKRLENSLYDTVITIREGRYHMICNNKSCREKGVYGVDGKACCPNCISWIKILCEAFRYVRPWADYECKRCGCSDEHHYFLEKVGFREKEKKKNLDIEKIILKEKSSLCKSYNRKNQLTDSMFEYRQRFNDIEKNIAGEMTFVKNNSIVPYHKECIDYIRMEIDKCTGNKKECLEDHLKRYQNLYNLFQRSYYHR